MIEAPLDGGAVLDAQIGVAYNVGGEKAHRPATREQLGEVKPGSGLAVASDGTLSAKVDGSTIDFNASGQLTALGGGGGISYFVGYIGGVGAGTKFGNFTAYSQETTAMYAAFLYGDDWVLLVGCWRQQVVYSATKLISVFNNAKDVMPQVNGYQTTGTKTVCGTGVLTGALTHPCKILLLITLVMPVERLFRSRAMLITVISTRLFYLPGIRKEE